MTFVGSARTGIGLPVVELLPSCPSLLYPQQYTLLSDVKAQVCAAPADNDVIVFPAMTFVGSARTGIGLLAVELLPSSPSSLYPQQYTLLSDVKAQVWSVPADIDVTVFPAMTFVGSTKTGTELLYPASLLPSSPESLYPQQYALPSDVTAQVWSVPADIDVTVFPAIAPVRSTNTGTESLAQLPFPS